ncbi:MAG TPA: sugar phosphate isomerase/epimerase family protein [Edaphobacter sp.]|nr:sugar phosphate isomerase/epimerase family protein [Edaphobacter sp.]
MTTRREFLRLSAMAAAAGCTLRASNAFAGNHDGMAYGVQLYMVRKQAPSDLAGVLKRIHQIGFSQIELYPIAYSHPPQELRKIVNDSGLKSDSGHFDYDMIESRIDYARQLGLKYMVCSILPPRLWGSPAGFKEAATNLNTWGKKVHDAGMQLCFHNHNYEFKPMDGTTGFDVLMKNTDPALVKLEFDLYWLTQAGQDPSAMMKRYADRLVLIHLKDRVANSPVNYAPNQEQHIIELGKGSIPWPKLISQARSQGVHLALVDQDETKLPIFESLKENYQYLESVKLS